MNDDCSKCIGHKVSMVIQVYTKNVDGNETIYPLCNKAKLFAEMIKQTSLTNRDIKYIKALGYSIEVIQTTRSSL